MGQTLLFPKRESKGMMIGETLLIPKTASHDGTMRCIERGRLNKINPIDVKE